MLCKVQTKSNEVSYQESVNGHIKVNGLVNDQFQVGEIEQHGKAGVEKGINHILHISQRLKICKKKMCLKFWGFSGEFIISERTQQH